MEIQIHHIGTQNENPMFEVIRSMDMKRTTAIPLPQPVAFPIEGHPAKQFLPELRWYLEEYLRTPFGAYQQLAEGVAETMRTWGTAVFDALFTGYARDWYQDAKRKNFEGFRIKITSNSPEIMSWPWEALHSRDDGYLALRCYIDRQLSSIDDPPPLAATLPQDVIHILYVIPRPYGEDDVGYHILANSVVSFISKKSLPVTVDVLRPPTFDQLRKVLYDHPGYYHIVHFDGHGGYGAATPTPAGNRYAAPEGQLVFETDNGGEDPIDTRRLAYLLAEYNIPIVVMNACRSGMIDEQAKDPFASVAAGLLKAGVRSVVAMGYSLYVSGAKKFVPAFYERLFSTGNVSEAMRAGRGKMMEQPERDCIIGNLPLQDWVVPILYQQISAESAILPRVLTGQKLLEDDSILPKKARVDGDYGFIGRGYDIQRLERTIQCQPQAAILIHGQAGIGKTSLVKGFLRWLENTGGLRERVFWFDFQEIHSVEYIINQLLSELAGTSSMAKPLAEKLPALVKLLCDGAYLLIWDNFESASGIEGAGIQPKLSAEDRNILVQLLKELRSGKTKVLITSRNKEAWLQIQSCYRLPLGGLAGEDLWEYCNTVVRDLGLTLDREDETYAKIVEKLCGNPLAIRAILLRLQDCSAKQLLAELESSFEGMEGDESTRRLDAAYMVFSESLTARFLPALQLIGLHEYYLNAGYTKAMLDSAGYSVEPEAIDSCYHILEDAGFCTHIGHNVYRLHPALRGYLLRQAPVPVPVQKGFVDIMGLLADLMAGKPLHVVKYLYQINIANFYYARQLAELHKMYIAYMALTQSLAYYAQEMRRFEEANKLYAALAEWSNSCNAWDSVALAFHQLGRIAESQRDFPVADTWYKKSLAIYEKRGDEHGVASTYYQLGNIAQERWDFAAAEAWYKQALIIFEKLGNEYCMSNIYNQLGRIAQEQRDFVSAEAWYKQALAIEEKQGNEHGLASTYHHLGMIAQEQRDFATAEAWYKKSLAIFEKQGNEHDAAGTCHQLGSLAEAQQDFTTAEAWYKKSLAIKEKQGDEHGVAGTYQRLGMLAQEQRDFAAAEAWYKKSLAIYEKHGDEHGAAMTYYQMGRIVQELRDFRSAKIWCKKALAIFEQGNEYGAAMTYHQLAIIANKQRDFATAEIWYKKSLVIHEKQGNEYHAAIIYHQLGIIAQLQQDIVSAKTWYKKSLAINEKQGDEHSVAITYYQLATLAQTKRDFTCAADFYLKALKGFVSANDSFNLKITIQNYAYLLHNAANTERNQLREMWSMYMDQELTKILEQMEVELYGTGN